MKHQALAKQYHQIRSQTEPLTSPVCPCFWSVVLVMPTSTYDGYDYSYKQIQTLFQPHRHLCPPVCVYLDPLCIHCAFIQDGMATKES